MGFMAKRVRLDSGKHNCFGAFDIAGPSEDPSQKQLERSALLVYAGSFQSMDGPVEISQDHLTALLQNHNSVLSKVKRLATGDIPAKACPPIQLDHSTSAKDTVGRLIGDLTMAPHTMSDGSEVMGLYGKVRILGQENVERVMDGRWTHLSIGADLDAGKISELTITPFPAAAEASLLKGGGCEVELAQGEEPKMDEKLKKHLMEKMGLSEEDANEKLSKMTDDDKVAMSATCDENTQQMSQETPPANPDLDKQEKDEPEHKEMSAAPAGIALSADDRAKVITLMKGIQAGSKAAQLAARKGQIQARLSALRAAAKLTPAEEKKIDLARLAAANAETVEAVLKSYEDREPVILTGVMGSVKATNAAEIGKDLKNTKLMADTIANMPSLRKAMLATGKLPEAQEGADEKTVANLSAAPHAGNTDTPTTEAQAQLTALAESAKSMQNQFDELMKLVGPLVGVKSSDL